MSTRFLGKYRGVVTNNLDPLQVGRIRARVSDVSGAIDLNWAMPCVPCGLSKRVAGSLPKIGASVWIEFEQGDPQRPIWTGCFYASVADTPVGLRNSK
jgi:hypothetical protein